MSLQSEHFRNIDRLAAAAANNPPLKQGESGEAVSRLQQALLDLGHSLPVSTAKQDGPDGIYGTETRLVVKAFQGGQRPPLSDDGIAGENTLANLDAQLVSRGKRFPPSNTPTVDASTKFNIQGTPAPQGLPPWVDWNARDYRQNVRDQIVKHLEKSRVGSTILAAIRGKVTIRPSPHAREARAFYKPSEGTLFYTPGSYVPSSKLYASSPHFVGYTPDAVLLHELVHAMRHRAGFWSDDQEEISKIHYPPWAPEDVDPRHYLFFGTRGEFNAIVITNTYRAEKEPGAALSGMARNMLLLVKDHHLTHIHIPLQAPESFHKSAKIRHYLKRLWNDQENVCRSIAGARASFNPLRDFKTVTP